MSKKRSKKNPQQELINLLQSRIKLLEIEKRHYEQNPTLMRNIKIANIELIQGQLTTLKELLSKIK